MKRHLNITDVAMEGMKTHCFADNGYKRVQMRSFFSGFKSA